jgi:glycosyltransferase involved in cell wall biosynthesis
LKVDPQIETRNRELPLLSVVIPSFNQAQFIERTILSIISQSYPRLELILMDGGSTDTTMAIVDRYKQHFGHIQSGPDGGQAAAIAKGFELASGDYISWLNSDDTYNEGALLAVGEFLAQNPQAQFAYGDTWIIDENDKRLAFKKSIRFVLPVMKYAFLTVPQMSAFWSRSLYNAVGGMDRSFRFCMDYDLFIRMAERSSPRRIGRTIGNFRVHGSSKTKNLEALRVSEDLIVHERYCAVKPSSGIAFQLVRYFFVALLVCLMAESGGLLQRLKSRVANKLN